MGSAGPAGGRRADLEMKPPIHLYGQPVRVAIGSVQGFDWDKGNIDKCAKHGVLKQEIEEVLRGEAFFGPDMAHSVDEDRFLVAGETASGRKVYVAFTIRVVEGQRLFRPISARYMHAKEARRYEDST